MWYHSDISKRDNNNADDQQEGTFLVRESENKTDELTLSVAAINEESDHVVSGDCDPKKAAKDNETDEMTNSGLENSISSALERDISAVNTSTNDQTEATLISDADNMDIQFGFLEDQEAENIQATEAVLENSASISNNGEINQYVNVNNIQLLILQGTKIVKGLHNYESGDDEELSFNKGDFMEIISEHGEWLQAKLLATGETGYIPVNYVAKEGSLENEEDNNNADDHPEATFIARESENERDELTLSVAAINEESDHVVSGDCDPKKAGQ
ncbi:hypothetical protein CAPTEDRAFT_187085 [Capitella teleta]|uniref:SH3 domain-containing protein n=1 Tax=Capitella teleta TaxID=283909 RepID=R7VLS2_CAPTE|nr:hypothetical protein CAPTEDRAFT_187085 [Capitella teleta]|eukprot:ELU17855.1 hypothetical protein CAPTEDRAFT_187085 [Capitella teleta]